MLFWQLRESHGSGSTSVLPLPWAFVPPLCPFPQGRAVQAHWAGGAAGPGTGSPLLLQLPGTEGAVGGNTTGVSWEMLQEQPDRGTQLPSWAEVPLWLEAVSGTPA